MRSRVRFNWKSNAGPVCRLLLAAGIAGLLVGCPGMVGDPDPGAGQDMPDPTDGGGGTNGTMVTVRIQGLAFVPKEVTVSQGQTVRWVNFDAAPHTTTSGSPGGANLGSVWRSSRLGNGATFDWQFNEVGEFVYFCELHPFIPAMRNAEVTVIP